MNTREDFFKTYGRYPITQKDTEYIDELMVNDLVNGIYMDDTVRSPETLDKIEKQRKLLETAAAQAKKEQEEDDLFRDNLHRYWRKQKELQEARLHNSKSNSGKHSQGGRSKRSKRTRVFRRKSNKKRSRRNSSRRK